MMANRYLIPVTTIVGLPTDDLDNDIRLIASDVLYSLPRSTYAAVLMERGYNQLEASDYAEDAANRLRDLLYKAGFYALPSADCFWTLYEPGVLCVDTL